jgi:hypothetical protein
MTAAGISPASLARQLAFEATVKAAGEKLKEELAAPGDDPDARRAAWDRYGAVQNQAGDDIRAAIAADRPVRPRRRLVRVAGRASRL